MKFFARFFAGFIPILLLNGGCTNLSVNPIAARSFDTIELGVGSSPRLTKVNTQVYFTPNGGSPIDITNGVRSIFKLYADKTSQVYTTTNPNITNNFKFLHHDTWQTVFVIDLPSLPIGPGKVSFVTSVPQAMPLEPTPLANYPDLNTIQMDLEILPGTGVSNPFDYATTSGGALNGDLKLLRPQRQAEITAPIEDTGSLWPNTFGAIEFVVDLSAATDSTGNLTEDSLRVVSEDVSTFTKSKAQMTWHLDNTDLKVIYISTSGKLQYYEPRFSIVGETADFPTPPTITSVAYYDINGMPAIGPSTTDYAVDVFGVLP